MQGLVLGEAGSIASGSGKHEKVGAQRVICIIGWRLED